MSQGRLQGCVATYLGHRGKKNKPKSVYITDHTYEVDGRLSNWVSFRYIKADGTLGKSDGDYDYGKENFVNVKLAKIKIL